MQGSNGEVAYMDPDERIELVKKVKEFALKEKLIIAGAACESTCLLSVCYKQYLQILNIKFDLIFLLQAQSRQLG